MNIANIGEILNIRRREMGLSHAELAMLLRGEGIDVTNQAISKWENGSTLPNAKQFLILCRVLEIDDIGGEFLVGGRGGLLAGLDNMGRKKVREYIELLRSSGLYDAEPEPERCRTLPLYSIAVSAGTGQFLDSEDYEMTEVGPEVPENANFGVRVAGVAGSGRVDPWCRLDRPPATGPVGGVGEDRPEEHRCRTVSA